jgi:hypothetical protein
MFQMTKDRRERSGRSPENAASIDCPNAWLPMDTRSRKSKGQFAALEF